MLYSAMLILALMTGVEAATGVFIDARGAVIAVATVFGGTVWVGLATSLAGAAARLLMGGEGALAGAAGMLLDWAACYGVVAAFARWRPVQRGDWGQLGVVALVVGMIEALSLFFVGGASGFEVTREVDVGIFGVQVVSTFLLGALMSLYLTREAALRAALDGRNRLSGVLKQAVRALGEVVMQRDMPTAEHQQRVAHLAVAIGRDLGLEPAQVEGLELASLVHDIGQIQVPGEIISRPGPLSSAEFDLVRMHPETGYEILKTIDFPWPVAEIVLQHHENVDGSGYPGGLAGEEIRIEARILRVADVMDALTSFRPFRAPLSVGPALEELRAMAGTSLDPRIVDTCIGLFTRGSYAFPRP
ncbi:HD-GYP domain-containing protein [Iodidimonas sp. SYSU 1G8]|uniref:HD-GYP domain-containing protein n=1 Tax=Iodidimonas sp. SYSU 1G8 TaxID=3133967 RepID=UPI0031FE5877